MHTPMEVAAALRGFIDAQGVEVDEAGAESGLRSVEQGGEELVEHPGLDLAQRRIEPAFVIA